MKKQTAVEFLLEKYKSQNGLLFPEDFKQAKEMEETQRKLDTFYGYTQGYDDGVANKEPMRPKLLDFKTEQEELGQHYNETFKSE